VKPGRRRESILRASTRLTLGQDDHIQYETAKPWQDSAISAYLHSHVILSVRY
jgi:hypothetical protein